MKKYIIGFGVASLLLGGLTVSNATIVLYTDRLAWETAMTSIDYLVDFNDYSTDTLFNTSAVDLGPFSLQQTAGSTNPEGNKIEVSPQYIDLDVNGTPYAAMWAFDGKEITMSFDDLTYGFGGDIQTFENYNLEVDLDLGSAGIAEWDHSGGSGFLGIVSDIGFSSAIFSDSGSPLTQTWGFDNISGGATAPVPEPATMLLFGTGIAGLAGSRLRRRKK